MTLNYFWKADDVHSCSTKWSCTGLSLEKSFYKVSPLLISLWVKQFLVRPSCESWYCVSVVLIRSTLSYPSKIHLVNKNRYQTLCVFMWAWICGHCVMGWIFVWLAHLSLRSGCKATGPTMTPEPIKWNINQISILILVSPSLCAHECWSEWSEFYNI